MKNKILVVDDDHDILKVLKANLELHDYQVSTADCWLKAQEEISSSTPDLIILDIMLPDGDGIDICRTLRVRFPTMPIIMLTAKDKVSDKVMGLESGSDDYVVKPFETLELIARIKACLRRAKPLLIDRVVIGDLSVDYKKRIVKIKGKEIELTPKEYEMLCILIAHRGEVLSREAIRKSLWKNAQLYSWSRVIDVHIQHLRQKIEKDPAEPEYILTVPGAGYKFRD